MRVLCTSVVLSCVSEKTHLLYQNKYRFYIVRDNLYPWTMLYIRRLGVNEN